jgi:hypothetical protein
MKHQWADPTPAFATKSAAASENMTLLNAHPEFSAESSNRMRQRHADRRLNQAACLRSKWVLFATCDEYC